MYEYKAKIIAWKDGDTVVVDIDLGFYPITLRQTVRVLGINCPEIHSKDPAEKARGLAALARAVELAPVGSEVMLRSFKPHSGDKFGRYLADVWLPCGGGGYAEIMTDEGHAKPWDGNGPKPALD